MLAGSEVHAEGWGGWAVHDHCGEAAASDVARMFLRQSLIIFGIIPRLVDSIVSKVEKTVVGPLCLFWHFVYYAARRN